VKKVPSTRVVYPERKVDLSGAGPVDVRETSPNQEERKGNSTWLGEEEG